MTLIRDKKAKPPKKFDREKEAKKLFRDTSKKTPQQLREMIKQARAEILDLRQEIHDQDIKLKAYTDLQEQIADEFWQIESTL